MKIYLLKISFFSLLLLLLLSSCYKTISVPKSKVSNDSSSSNNNQNINDNNLNNEIQTPVSIKWGYGYGMGNMVEIPKDAEIVKYINDKFNVTITPMLLQNGQVNKSSLPDIFVAYRDDMRLYQASGLIRTIPREMIEQYAPSYASLLNGISYGWKIYEALNQDENLGLCLYNSNIANLSVNDKKYMNKKSPKTRDV